MKFNVYNYALTCLFHNYVSEADSLQKKQVIKQQVQCKQKEYFTICDNIGLFSFVANQVFKNSEEFVSAILVLCLKHDT